MSEMSDDVNTWMSRAGRVAGSVRNVRLSARISEAIEAISKTTDNLTPA
jgi:hypothetical protein